MAGACGGVGDLCPLESLSKNQRTNDLAELDLLEGQIAGFFNGVSGKSGTCGR